MTDVIVIRDPGPATTVQDFGRPDMRRFGVPVAGTLSPDWLHLANALVGAPVAAAGLDFRLAGPRFTVESDSIRVVVGGPAEIRIDGPDGTRTVPPWTAAVARRGETVAVGRVLQGTTAVLAVSGGIATPPVLGSRATYVRAGLGGHEGRALRPGDRLPLGPQTDLPPLALPDPPVDARTPIRIVPGPQDDHFDTASHDAFLGGDFTVTDKIDRMGMRLDGPALHHCSPDLTDIVSDGIVPGAVQVPGNGQPIVLLADGQTVGGYPKIATVISADLPRLARRSPGDLVRFLAVDPAEAARIGAAATRARAALLDRARPASGGGLDLRRLYDGNLISGVHNAHDTE